MNNQDAEIRWGVEKLCDLDYIDGIAIVSYLHKGLQQLTNDLNSNADGPAYKR